MATSIRSSRVDTMGCPDSSDLAPVGAHNGRSWEWGLRIRRPRPTAWTWMPCSAASVARARASSSWFSPSVMTRTTRLASLSGVERVRTQRQGPADRGPLQWDGIRCGGIEEQLDGGEVQRQRSLDIGVSCKHHQVRCGRRPSVGPGVRWCAWPSRVGACPHLQRAWICSRPRPP